MNRSRRGLLSWIGLAVAAIAVTAGATRAQTPRYNVLFIAVDDLRPQLGCYGDPVVKSPNIDRIAKQGLVCSRAYCQQAVCSPSRSSLLTGRRPDTTKVWDLETHFRTAIPDVVTLPQHFKNNGYHAQGVGKIYHGGYDDAPSWTLPWAGPKAPRFGPEGQALMQKLRQEARASGRDVGRLRGMPYEAPEVEDTALADGSTASQAIRILGDVKDKPFFLAVGFANPHLPFVAPKKYWDLYKPEQIKLADNPYPPKDAPAYAPHTFGELRQYYGIPKQGPVSREQARGLVHGYYAAISYMDSQVGRVLDELERLKLRDKTVVVLWGDHGWQLEEHGMWCKHSNYETSARAPLIMSMPGQKVTGKRTQGLTEFVDIYPTLVEACGLPKPEGLEGTSFVPLLNDPNLKWKSAAFSQYPRQVPTVGRVMGYSMKTDRYRFVEWAAPAKDFAEYELYDHQSDPNENTNIAKRPENAELIKQLSAQLKAGWKAALPKGVAVSSRTPVIQEDHGYLDVEELKRGR